MKFALFIVVLTIMVSVEAVPTPGIELPSSDPDYFKENLKSVQGAIKDTLRAGQDLEAMEKVLQNIVNLSSHIWRAESATEYATASNAYTNGWKSGGGKYSQRNFYRKRSSKHNSLVIKFSFYTLSLF